MYYKNVFRTTELPSRMKSYSLCIIGSKTSGLNSLNKAKKLKALALLGTNDDDDDITIKSIL